MYVDPLTHLRAVNRLEIDPCPSQVSYFCRKALALTEDPERLTKNFREEDRVLKLLNTVRHPNILEHLASYHHRGVYNIISPLADMDLETLLGTNRSQTPFRSDYMLVSAMHGIASALESLHHFFGEEYGKAMIGCHHDIKPQNILVYGCRFVLADFGLSRLKNAEDGSSTIFKGMGDYIAPECRAPDLERLSIGRKSDVWSFGAVLMEVCCYIIGGSVQVSDLRKARLTTSGVWTNRCFHDGSELKPTVRRFISKLHDRVSVDRPVSDLIAESMKMLQPGVSHRPSTAEASQTLQELHAKVLIHDTLALFEKSLSAAQDSLILIERERFHALQTIYASEPQQPVTAPIILGSEEPIKRSNRIISQINGELERYCQEFNSNPRPTTLEIDTNADLCASVVHQLNSELASDLSPAQRMRLNHLLFRRLTEDRSIESVKTLEQVASKRGGDRELRSMLELRYLSLRLDILKNAALTSFRETESVELDESFGSHTLGTYRSNDGVNERVLIEWRNIPWIDDRARMNSLLSQMQLLADLPNASDKPSNFRVLESGGFFLNQAKNALGMIYRLPANLPRDALGHANPTSLRDMMRLSRGGSAKKLSLGSRFAIAHAISSCVYYFHTVDWFHKNLNSSNIMFCNGIDSNGSSLSSKPYIIGFNYSRHLGKEDLTQDPNPEEMIYQHPTYRSDKPLQTLGKPLFEKRFDYYSAGLVLLEIAMWRSISSVERKHTPNDAEHLRQILLTEYVPGLAFSAGELYQQAVKNCLQSESINEEQFRLGVVDKLGRCFA